MAKNPYGYPEFISSTGYGTGPGLKGWNCYHDFHPFIPGVDEPNYTEEEVAQMNAEDNIKRKFGDKEYTAYEATQRQRELERVMRKYGEESHLLELGGADEDTLLATKVRYQTASQEYAAFSKAMGLPQQRERIRNGMESLAQYAQTAQKPLDISGESGIMNLGSDEMQEIRLLGKLKTSAIEQEFGKLNSEEIVITSERLLHIEKRHPQDYQLFQEYGKTTVEVPDLIVRDLKNKGTAFFIKKLPDTNLNVVMRLALDTDRNELKNSVLTFYRIRDKNLKKLINKNKVLYKSE